MRYCGVDYQKKLGARPPTAITDLKLQALVLAARDVALLMPRLRAERLDWGVTIPISGIVVVPHMRAGSPSGITACSPSKRCLLRGHSARLSQHCGRGRRLVQDHMGPAESRCLVRPGLSSTADRGSAAELPLHSGGEVTRGFTGELLAISSGAHLATLRR